jgi:hypothetical protein
MTDIATVLVLGDQAVTLDQARKTQGIVLAPQTSVSALLHPVQVTVRHGDLSWSASVATLLKYRGLKVSALPDILLSANLPDGIRGYPYTGTISAMNIGGATGDITITVDELPTGLSLGDTITTDSITYTATLTGTLQ